MRKKREDTQRRLSRRAFVKGAAAGALGVWAATSFGRHALVDDPERPPELYEFFLDNFWFDSIDLYSQPVNAPLKGSERADIAIVGGGFAGLSTAYNLARIMPDKRIVVLEGAMCGYGASGRNGGHANVGAPGLHTVYAEGGLEAARQYYEATVLGMDQIREMVDRHGVDCDLEFPGRLLVATEQSQIPILEAQKARFDEIGLPCELLDKAALRGKLASERFVAGFREPEHAILNPAKLARGMKRVVEAAGVDIFERSKVMRIEHGPECRIVTEHGELRAPKVAITLNGYAPQLGIMRRRLIPLCNYVSATEPLSAARLASLGWLGREGVSDMRVQFMYLRLSADNRIVFGGESSPYFYESSPSSGNYRPALERQRRSLLETFPQLEGVRFTHGWGGTMGFTMDFMPTVGRLGDRDNVFHALGFNGEGVVMTQLAGRILAELIAGVESPLTGLPLVGRRPAWVGPEPLRYLGVKLYEKALTLSGSNPVQ